MRLLHVALMLRRVGMQRENSECLDGQPISRDSHPSAFRLRLVNYKLAPSSFPEDLQPRPPRHQSPHPRGINKKHVDENENQTPAKHEAVIPLGPCGQQHRGQLRRRGVEDVAPVNGPPHVGRDIGHLVRPAQIPGKGPGAPERQENGQRNLDEQGQGKRHQRRLDDAHDSLESGASGPKRGDPNLAPPGPPSMADKGQRRGLERLHRHHDQAPADRVEDAPGSGVRAAHRDDVADQPQVECVADGRFGEHEKPRAQENSQGPPTGCHLAPPTAPILLLRPTAIQRPTSSPEKVPQPRRRSRHITRQLDPRLQRNSRPMAPNPKPRHQQQLEHNLHHRLDTPNNKRHIRLIQRPRRGRHRRLDRRAQRDERTDAHIHHAHLPHLARHKPPRKGLGASRKGHAHDQPQQGLDQDEGVCQREALGRRARRLVADDGPGRAREPLVEDLGDDAGVGVGVGGGDEGGVDRGDPELGEGADQGQEGEGEQVEGKRADVVGAGKP